MKKMKGYMYLLAIMIISLSAVIVTYFGLQSLDLIVQDKLPVTIKIVNAEYTYDDESHSCSEFAYTGKLQKGDSIVAMEYLGSITEAGEASISGRFKVVDQTGADVTNNYSLTVENGSCTVKPRNISISGVDLEKIYEGKPVQSTDFTYDENQLIFEASISKS